MTNDRRIEHLLDTWLVDGPTMAPDRVIDDVAARITRQPQRPAWRLRSWRFPTVSTPLKLVLIGAALVAALVAGSILVGAGGQPAVPAPTPSPSPTPIPALPEGSLGAGTYVLHPAPAEPSLAWTITVPAGWAGYDGWAVYAQLPAGDPGVFVGGPSGTATIPADSCAPTGHQPAESVDEIIEAVQARDDWTVSEPVDVTISGYAGTRIEIELPTDLPCPNDEYMVIVENTSGDGFHAQAQANHFTLWVLDVEGQPMVFQRTFGDTSSAAPVSQSEDIVTTSVITP